MLLLCVRVCVCVCVCLHESYIDGIFALSYFKLIIPVEVTSFCEISRDLVSAKKAPQNEAHQVWVVPQRSAARSPAENGAY